MTKTMQDVENFIAAAKQNGKLQQMATEIAADIRRWRNSELGERSLIGIDYLNTFIYDPAACASHDYVDPNYAVHSGVGDFCVRNVGIDHQTYQDAELVSQEPPQKDTIVIELMRLGWDQVKKEGFSALWSSIDDVDIRHDLGLLILELPPSESGARLLGKALTEHEDAALARLAHEDADLMQAIQSDIQAIVDEDKDASAIVTLAETIASNRRSSLKI